MSDKASESANIPDGMDEKSKLSNAAANKFVNETEHVALNADTEDAETIIRNMRFMAYGIGWDDGYEKGREAGRAEWVPVSERLPEIDEDGVTPTVLFLTESGHRHVGFYVSLLRGHYLFDDRSAAWRVPTSEGAITETEVVTHWQPLPPAPKALARDGEP